MRTDPALIIRVACNLLRAKKLALVAVQLNDGADTK
jgi:hypothetical protein